MQKMFTIGVEEEFQIVDPSTRDLRPQVEQMLASGRRDADREYQARDDAVDGGDGQPYLRDVEQARQEVVKLRSGLGQLAATTAGWRSWPRARTPSRTGRAS